MVEGALKSALNAGDDKNQSQGVKDQSTLTKSFVQDGASSGKIKVIPLT